MKIEGACHPVISECPFNFTGLSSLRYHPTMRTAPYRKGQSLERGPLEGALYNKCQSLHGKEIKLTFHSNLMVNECIVHSMIHKHNTKWFVTHDIPDCLVCVHHTMRK